MGRSRLLLFAWVLDQASLRGRIRRKKIVDRCRDFSSEEVEQAIRCLMIASDRNLRRLDSAAEDFQCGLAAQFANRASNLVRILSEVCNSRLSVAA